MLQHTKTITLMFHWFWRRAGPVIGSWQHPVGYDLSFLCCFAWHELVTLLPVAATMGKLKVGYVRGVASFSQGYDVVYCWTEGVGIF